MISSKEENILALAKEVLERKKVLYIASHSLLIQQRKKQLLDITAGYIGIHWTTLSQFADRILQACGKAYVRINQAIREDLVESIMLSLEKQGKPVTNHLRPSCVSTVTRKLRGLKEINAVVVSFMNIMFQL